MNIAVHSHGITFTENKKGKKKKKETKIIHLHLV